MQVTDTGALARVLDGMKVEYKILSDTEADIFAKLNITELALALSAERCEVHSVTEKDDSLESYYISLVGGERHA